MNDPTHVHVRWILYLIRNSAGRFYTGITTDMVRRLAQHNGTLTGGAKSTRGGRPWEVVRLWGPFDRSIAGKLEYELKRLPGRERSLWEPPSDVRVK